MNDKMQLGEMLKVEEALISKFCEFVQHRFWHNSGVG